MNTLRLFLILLIAPAAIGLADDASDEGLAPLQGDWVAEFPVPPVVMTIRMTIQDDQFSMKFVAANDGPAPPPQVSGKIKVDNSKTPKQIDLFDIKVEGRDQPERDLNGIYKLEDSTLTICPPPKPGDPRPSEFPDQAGDAKRRLLVFKKQADAEKTD